MPQSLCVSIIQNALYMRVWTESISPMPFWSLTEHGWSVHEGGRERRETDWREGKPHRAGQV